jgi:hypothetical protein
MSARALRWIGCTLLGAGLLGFVLTFSGAAIIWPNDGKEIFNEARAIIGEKPVYPPKPEGRTEKESTVEYHDVETCYDVVLVPILPRQHICNTAKVPSQVVKERFVSPNTAEMTKWQTQAQAIDDEYNRKLNAKIRELERRNQDNRRAELRDWAQILGTPASTLLGIAMLLLGIRKDRREGTMPTSAVPPPRRLEDT